MFALPRAAVYLLLSLAVALVVFTLHYDRYLWEPNSVAPTFGGDGLTIHYNMQYHATHGEGVELTSQYYPYAESIFLTDAQGVVSVILASLRPVIPEIGSYAVGVSNALIHWSNIASVLLLYLVFRRLKLPVPAALLFGLLTAMMSPQIARQLGGQYSLGYTFLLPLLLYYQLSAETGKRYWPASLGVGSLIVVLGLNNPYLFAIGTSFLLIAAVIAALVRLTGHDAFSWRSIRHWVLVSSGSAALIYGVISYLDRMDDRVAIPFGYFKNVAHWGGLLTSPELFTYQGVRSVLPNLQVPGGEQAAYLGLVPILFAVTLPVLLGLLLRRSHVLTHMDRRLSVLLAGAGAVMAYAFGLPFSYFPDWTFDNLGLVLQFRAPARFTWPAYYTLSVVAGYGLYHLSRTIPSRPLGAALLAIGVGIWSVEAHQFTRARLDDRVHQNAFGPEKLNSFRAIASSFTIDTARYAGVYLLPSEQGWSDKILRDGAWRSNLDGYRLSLATGIPLLNGKLTRIPVGHTLASLQLISDPLIERSLLEKIPEDRAILLLTARDTKLLPGEEALRRTGTLVYQNDFIELRSLYPKDIRLRTDSVRSARLQEEFASPQDYIHVPMEENDAFAFVGRGSRRITKRRETVAEVALDTTHSTDLRELSFWNYVDHRYFGGPVFYLTFLNGAGESIREERHWINDSPDTQNGWLRATFTFEPPPETASLRVVGEYTFPYYIDELLLRRSGATVRMNTDGALRLNNYLIGEGSD